MTRADELRLIAEAVARGKVQRVPMGHTSRWDDERRAQKRAIGTRKARVTQLRRKAQLAALSEMAE